MIRQIKKWLPLWIVIAGMTFVIYAAGQQILRMGANDPQMQMARDLAARLDGGENTKTANGEKVAIEVSLAPYVVVYDATGKPVAGTGYLNGELPMLPPGVFSYTASRGEDRVTWQPGPKVRSAIVMVRYNKGFVMAGRSLREVEVREDNLLKMVMAGAAGIILAAGLAIAIVK